MDPIEARFLDDIGQRPADAETRRLYADWLEANGAPVKAEFLRAQTAMRTLSVDDPGFAPATQRLQELLPQTEIGWRARVAQGRIENCFVVVAQCPQRWDNLRPTQDPKVRRCDYCQHNVRYCSTVEELSQSAGHCVTFDASLPSTPDHMRRLMVPMTGMVMQQPPATDEPPPEAEGGWIRTRLRKILGLKKPGG
jgi:uncharacterized protein (TIGR02996 family)